MVILWRDVRAVEGESLENFCTERYRGFESHSLRHVGAKSALLRFPFSKQNVRTLPGSSSSAKSPAPLACSLASALPTPRYRYQLFAALPLRCVGAFTMYTCKAFSCGQCALSCTETPKIPATSLISAPASPVHRHFSRSMSKVRAFSCDVVHCASSPCAPATEPSTPPLADTASAGNLHAHCGKAPHMVDFRFACWLATPIML